VRGLLPFLAPAFATICAVCALAGCTTVSAPTARPSAPPPSTPGRPEQPDDARVVPAPAHRVLATARPKTPAPEGRRDHAPAAAPAPPRPAPRRAAPRTPASGRLPRPAAPDVCGLGEAYGGWVPGGQASTICREVYHP
jgi:hypothetical protein